MIGHRKNFDIFSVSWGNLPKFSIFSEECKGTKKKVRYFIHIIKELGEIFGISSELWGDLNFRYFFLIMGNLEIVSILFPDNKGAWINFWHFIRIIIKFFQNLLSIGASKTTATSILLTSVKKSPILFKNCFLTHQTRKIRSVVFPNID